MSTDSHAHPAHLAHHFETSEQQFEASKLGTWLFLATEILMFGGLFVGYLIYHGLYPEMFAEGAATLSWKLGTLNTVVLLFSSLTMALAIHYAQTGNKSRSELMMLITIGCGFIFMGVKAVEYTGKYDAGLLPGMYFSAEATASNLAMYYSFYFLMTGLHGSHVLIGMGLIFWVFLRSRRGDFNPEHYTAIECVGLFWHLVDLIWIYLFPLLYLVG